VSSTDSMSREAQSFLDLLCYMATSARGCVDEPTIYGPFRLVDAMQKLIAVLDDCGIAGDFLQQQLTYIADSKLLMVEDEKGFVDFLDELVLRFATKLKRA